MVFGVDHKPERWKKTIKKVSLPERSVIPKGILSLSLLFYIK